MIGFSARLLTLLSGLYLWISAPMAGSRVHINDNRQPAGVLRNGVLTLELQARVGSWHPNGDSGPAITAQAFAERGRAPEIPGPLIRVPAGTLVEASVENVVPNTTLVVHGLSSRLLREPADTTSMRVGTGETRRVRFRLDAPGTYYYWGTTSGRRLGLRIHEDAQLTGAIVVDEPAKANGPPPRDRILLIGMMGDTIGGENLHKTREHLLFVVNGRTWPHTERLSYYLGDTIRWRVLNATTDPHPMHLHGAYFRVDSRGNGDRDSTYAPDARDLANTEFLAPGTTMTMSWSPVHTGNWLFHCHIPEHFAPRGPLGVLPATPVRAHTIANHALEGMSGLVMGISVKSKKGSVRETKSSLPRRRLRLLVRTNKGSTPENPSYGFSLHEGGAQPPADSGFHPGPLIVIVRGQPVGIMVVNQTNVPTAIHWHGIELESYYDGVAGFSGTQQRIAPVIAPRDSFEARFTPPRSGTFMYHTHIDEIQQQRAGLAGVLLVLDPGKHYDPATDIPILVSSPSDDETEAQRVLLNGTLTPPPLELDRGVTYRLRFANITTLRPGLRVEMRRDSSVAMWTPLAKDGADLPMSRRVLQSAGQRVSIGETFDVLVTPSLPGITRLEMLTNSGSLLGTLVVRVR
jgi:FtsP/CotA-like multicopper oxidase with cupredoxin domain